MCSECMIRAAPTCAAGGVGVGIRGAGPWQVRQAALAALRSDDSEDASTLVVDISHFEAAFAKVAAACSMRQSTQLKMHQHMQIAAVVLYSAAHNHATTQHECSESAFASGACRRRGAARHGVAYCTIPAGAGAALASLLGRVNSIFQPACAFVPLMRFRWMSVTAAQVRPSVTAEDRLMYETLKASLQGSLA